MPVVVKTTLLLVCSNVFMTFAWYAPLRDLRRSPWLVYLLQVPANRIGSTELQLGQLKILQEVITLSVFVPFSVLYMGEQMKLDVLWAALCMCAAVYFVFRG